MVARKIDSVSVVPVVDFPIGLPSTGTDIVTSTKEKMLKFEETIQGSLENPLGRSHYRKLRKAYPKDQDEEVEDS